MVSDTQARSDMRESKKPGNSGRNQDPMKLTTPTAADFVCYKYDTTKYISEDSLCRKLGLTVLAVYACDRNRMIYGEYMAPFHELMFLYYTVAGPGYPENDSDREALAEELMEGGHNAEPVMHVRRLREENIVKEWGIEECIDEEAWDELMEKVMDQWRSNRPL